MGRHRWWLAAALALAGCGGREVQTPSCAAFVACVQALDAAAGIRTNADRFAADGVCWANETLAAGCATACERGLVHLRERRGGLPAECVP